MRKYLLTLYVAGQTARSQSAITNLRRICEEVFASEDYDLRIVDVLERPEAAERARILATPTLIRELPLPARRIIGDLSDSHHVIAWIDPQWHTTEKKEEIA